MNDYYDHDKAAGIVGWTIIITVSLIVAAVVYAIWLNLQSY